MLYFALLNHFLFAAKVFLRDVKVAWLSTLHAPVTEARCENDPSLLRNVKNCHGLKCKRREHSRQLIGKKRAKSVSSKKKK